ncbi:MAG: Calx-beta domain-containing protein, partial [Verrucomicrobium sp.]
GTFFGYATAQIPLGAVSVASFTPTAPTKITIRDNNVALPSPSTVTASVQGKVQRVRASLTNFSHELPYQVTVFLGGPDSLNIALFTYATAWEAKGVNLTFDDAAPTLFPLTQFPVGGGGTFRPWDFAWIYEEWFSYTGEPAGDERGFTLGEFNGLNANGQWRLYVQDWESDGSGSIDSWSLELTSVQCTDNVMFTASSQSGDEAAGSALVTVRRTGGREGSATVNYATSAGTATAGTDYTTVSGTLTFLPGELVKTISIPIVNDSVIEAGETVQLTLSSATGSSTLGSQSTSLVTILSDDYAEIAVEGADGSDIPDHGVIIYLGQVGPGGASAPLSFLIRNTGNVPLTGVAVNKAGPGNGHFVINASSVSSSLAAGASAAFTVSLVPTLAGSHAATIQITSSDLDENPFDIFFSGKGLTAMEDWRLLHFGVTENAGNAANGADGDFDGLTNLLEFAVQSDPDAASTSPLRLVPEGASLEASYTRSKAALQAGFVYVVEWSDTLQAGSWSSVGVVESLVVEDALMQSMKATLPAGSGTARFVRLRVTGN